MVMKDNKLIVKELKESIEYRDKHLEFIEAFKYAIQGYFINRYDVPVRALTFGNTFGVELNYAHTCYDSVLLDKLSKFEFNIGVLSDFCNEFECEFVKTTCDGKRFIFTFKDVPMEHAFILF